MSAVYHQLYQQTLKECSNEHIHYIDILLIKELERLKYADLPKWSAKVGKWAGKYYHSLHNRPVRSKIKSGQFLTSIPKQVPEQPQSMEQVFADFEHLVPDAMTHWQHPRFFAYFPANAAPASIIAEQIINTMACNCMLWQTSPAATELEQRMIEWTRDSVGLPNSFAGLIQDSATTATLCAILTMREKTLGWQGLKKGLYNQPEMRIYASPENHSSVDKAARISGIGQKNLVKIPTDDQLSMQPAALYQAIQNDIHAGKRPAGVVICFGGTANGACDRVKETISVAKKFDLYCHVDAAWAGAAMICPEYRYLWEGIQKADSIVINAHKWTGAQFDCSLQFLAKPILQQQTLALQPEYLKTEGHSEITNYHELTIPLGRRFRALKLWFVFRVYGLTNLRTMIRNHINWVQNLEAKFADDPIFEIVSSSPFALFSFRVAPGIGDSDQLTPILLQRINDDGRIYLTPSVYNGHPVIRMTAGTFECTKNDVMQTYDIVKELASQLIINLKHN